VTIFPFQILNCELYRSEYLMIRKYRRGAEKIKRGRRYRKRRMSK
jgi:hypothetical protein